MYESTKDAYGKVNHTQFGLWATKCDANKMKWNEMKEGARMQ